MAVRHGGMQHAFVGLSAKQLKALDRLQHNFDGKIYSFRREYTVKSEAVAAARKERSYGFLSRVTVGSRKGRAVYRLWYRRP